MDTSTESTLQGKTTLPTDRIGKEKRERDTEINSCPRQNGRIGTQPLHRSAFKALLSAKCLVLTGNLQFKCLLVTFKIIPM